MPQDGERQIQAQSIAQRWPEAQLAIETGYPIILGIDHYRIKTHTLGKIERQMQSKRQQIVADTLPLQPIIHRQTPDTQNRHRVTRQLQVRRKFGGSYLPNANRDKAGNDILSISQGYVGLAQALALLLPGLPGKKIVECSDTAIEAIAIGMAIQQFDAKCHLVVCFVIGGTE